ncbi:TPA: hypothetical protein I7730_17790 [Vibrio vulnificus]|uniref:Uncharacterized protein n=1 Tax=Vibrio vulnificus TaxID=672 RepID=A0A8H9TGM4_VIBVL|nr:hypothetical protein [Vibrio vulnificus]RZQ12374.1 hypothetical protein D8T46_16095 [Vibrio vulnificus]HAS8491688.1 hypothetical protein [Vibrio vulnificus]HAS8499861.1 hypothetical protein [Vibrio vulnificus]HAS8541642.1 hypothetical protein [Vibrio vulnificus]
MDRKNKKSPVFTRLLSRKYRAFKTFLDGVLTPRIYSIFWICSRICSISTLSSTPEAVMSVAIDFDASVLDSRLNSCIMKSKRRPTAPPFFKMLVVSLT